MVMKKASGDDSPLRQGAGKSFWTLPDLAWTMVAACSMFRGKLIGGLRFFLSRGIYRRKGGVRRWTSRSHS
jgi:hypothetical protein